MRSYGIAASLLIVAAAALLGLYLFSPPSTDLPDGDQEIAWIHPATSSLTWDQFVNGVRRFEDSPEGQALGLHVVYDRAYPEQTTALPELVLSRAASEQRLHIRWYKLTSQTDAAYWVRHFSRRRPPLAIIGGSTSDRAKDLALALRQAHQEASRPMPLLLITTATADRVHLPEEPDESPELNALYPGRTFRFCFTNSQMAEALVSFVAQHDALRPVGSWSVVLGLVSAPPTHPLERLGPLAVALSAPVFSVEWNDDPYSLDLAEHLRHQFRQTLSCRIVNRRIPYSTGDVLRPNGPEQAVVAELADAWARLGGQRPLLLLPAGERPLRRVLRHLAATAPSESRQAVVVTGDALNLDIVYRDRDTLWPILEIPFTLVFFAHENPVAWSDEPQQPAALARAARGGTQDLLLQAHIVRLITEAAWHPEGDASLLVASPDALAERLRQRTPAFFDASGNRLQTSGAYVILLQPRFEGPRVVPEALLSVWRGRAPAAAPSAPPREGPGQSRERPRPWQWKKINEWPVVYGQSSADL